MATQKNSNWLQQLRADWLDPIVNPLACLPMMLPSEESQDADRVLKQLDAALVQKLRYALTGEKPGLLMGQGLDFADLRQYSPGDDIRKIDWNVFARTLIPHIKEYHEEKQLTVWLVVDLTPSMYFGQRHSKAEMARSLAGLLGLMAQRANYKLGAFLFSEKTTEIIPPKSGYSQLQRIMRQVLVFTPHPNPLPQGERGSESISQIENGKLFAENCEKLAHVVQKHATIFFLSDFLTPEVSRWDLSLGRLSRHSRLIPLLITDPVEMRLPANAGLLVARDPETGESAYLDMNDAGFRKRYEETAHQRKVQLVERLSKLGRPVTIETNMPQVEALMRVVSSVQPRRAAG